MQKSGCRWCYLLSKYAAVTRSICPRKTMRNCRCSASMSLCLGVNRMRCDHTDKDHDERTDECKS